MTPETLLLALISGLVVSGSTLHVDMLRAQEFSCVAAHCSDEIDSCLDVDSFCEMDYKQLSSMADLYGSQSAEMTTRLLNHYCAYDTSLGTCSDFLGDVAVCYNEFCTSTSPSCFETSCSVEIDACAGDKECGKWMKQVLEFENVCVHVRMDGQVNINYDAAACALKVDKSESISSTSSTLEYVAHLCQQEGACDTKMTNLYGCAKKSFEAGACSGKSAKGVDMDREEQESVSHFSGNSPRQVGTFWSHGSLQWECLAITVLVVLVIGTAYYGFQAYLERQDEAYQKL